MSTIREWKGVYEQGIYYSDDLAVANVNKGEQYRVKWH